MMGELRSEMSRIYYRCIVVYVSVFHFVGFSEIESNAVLIRKQNETDLQTREACDAGSLCLGAAAGPIG